MGTYAYNATNDTLDLIAGSGDTSTLANKTDLTAIILTGTTNTSGSTITSGTWFYLNGTPCIAKVDIASGATFTLNTNYEEKTVGSALSELNSKLGYSFKDITSYLSTSRLSFTDFQAFAHKSGREVTINIYFKSMTSSMQAYGEIIFNNLTSLNLGVADGSGYARNSGIIIGENLDSSFNPNNIMILSTSGTGYLVLQWTPSFSSTTAGYYGSITYIAQNDTPIP